MSKKEEYIKKLRDCVVNADDEEVAEVANAYIEAGFSPLEGIEKGLISGMNEAGRLYEADEYFVSDLIICSDAMYAGLEVLKPHISAEDSAKVKGKVVIGVVEGDTHDIGKNLVKIMLETAGYEIYDLGRDVTAADFIQKTNEVGASLLCLSTLMTTTMGKMEEVIHCLAENNIRDKVKVIIGGGPVSQIYCDKIGADGYSENAVEAVKLADRLLSEV